MSDMPERVRRCTTHHHACDCREYEFEQAKVRIEELTAEIEEQARLLGASGSREAELLARIEALEKDFAYHVELCTSQQARIGALEELVAGLEEVRSKEYEFKQARIEALEKAARALHNRIISLSRDYDADDCHIINEAIVIDIMLLGGEESDLAVLLQEPTK